MNRCAIFGLVIVNLVLIGIIVTCLFFIGNKCEERETKCIIWSPDGGDNCKIKYDSPDYTTVCSYEYKCNPDKNITIECYFDDVEQLDIECPALTCRGSHGGEIAAILGIVLGSIFETLVFILLIMSLCDNYETR